MAITKDIKNINVEIHIDVWRKLKLMAISKDMLLQDVVRSILDKAVSKSNVEVPGE